MDIEPRISKHSYKVSIQSRRSQLSSCRSLQRPSWCEREKSLSKNHSLIDVMSLESGRKSDIYDRMIAVDQKDPIFARQSVEGPIHSNPYEQQIQYNVAPFRQRLSEEATSKINHTCSCYSTCEATSCECFTSKYQKCIEGYCCSNCIEMKQKILKGEFNPVSQPQSTFCTCKKTKCNKKYCSCFAAGVHCGQKCSCEGCINCIQAEQAPLMEQQREEISQQQLARMQMPEDMDFQPVQFRFSNT